MNGRMYRGTWLLVGIPLLIAAFSVARPEPLPRPTLPPTFDAVTARALALELVRTFPDRSPGSLGATGAQQWVTARLQVYGFVPEARSFQSRIAGGRTVRLVNVIAEAPGRSRSTIAVLAHRDDSGRGVGANDNASGTAALLELARAFAQRRVPGRPVAVRPAHTIAFVSTDGGAFGGLGADELARDPRYADRLAAVVVLDSIAGAGSPRLVFAGDVPRSPPATLLQTAAARLLEETGARPDRPSALRQLVDLGFPFSLHEQAPFVARGIPAVTLTSGSERPPDPFEDSRLNANRLGQLGRTTESLLRSLDEGLPIARGESVVYLGPRVIRGWAVQLVLIASLLPFFAATVDLFARCRRRRVALAPAIRSFRLRLAFWTFAGLTLWVLAVLGALPEGPARPLATTTDAATEWATTALFGAGGVVIVAWLVVRQRLIPSTTATPAEEVAGYTVGLLALAVVALVCVATNPYALLFLLPSLHVWLWLPQMRSRPAWIRGLLLLGGLLGPLLVVVSLAIRYGLGVDAPWYLLALASVGYVEPTSVAIVLAWAAAAAQLTAVAAHRYAPTAPRARRETSAPGTVVARIMRRRREAPEESHALEA